MSDYHIRKLAVNLKRAECVFHYLVPTSGTNSAGISWIAAVRIDLFQKDESGNEIPIFSVLPVYHPQNYPGGIETAEETQIQSGEVVEETVPVQFSSVYLTDEQRKDEIAAKHTEWATELQARLQIELAWTGYRADVN